MGAYYRSYTCTGNMVRLWLEHKNCTLLGAVNIVSLCALTKRYYLLLCQWNLMRVTKSTESSDEEYQRYKHSCSTVSSPHQLTILTEKKNCDYRCIVRRLRGKQSIDVISVAYTSVLLDNITTSGSGILRNMMPYECLPKCLTRRKLEQQTK